MKAVHATAVLLAATACAVGMTVAVARPAATATLTPIDLKVPALNTGFSHLPGPVRFAEDDPDVVAPHSRNDLTAPVDDVAPTDQTSHQCRSAEQPTTPSAESSTEPKTSPAAPVAPATESALSQSVPAQPAPLVSGGSTCGPDGTAGVLPITPPKCTVNATNASQVNSAKGGDTVCFSGGSLAGSRLNITASGTEGAPITITGDGNTAVKGIRVSANNVVIQGFNVIGAAAPGVQLKGNNLTLQNTKIDHPAGGDHDGIRYFGDGIKILHNQISNITNTGGAHADCMQTYATTTPTSHNVLISGNRCENIDNQCLIAQGPHSRAGDGSGRGESSGLTFTNNFCDAHASQAVHIDDVQNVTIMNNDIQGRVQKAFNFINNSSGAKVSCNKLGSGVGKEVIADGSSRLRAGSS